MSITEIYDQTIKPLPPSDRLELARLILDHIGTANVVDYSTEWSDEDLQDASLHSMRNAVISFGEEGEDA